MEDQPLPTQNQHKMQLERMETQYIYFFFASFSMHENGIPGNSGTRTWVFMVIVAKETAEISYQESIFLPCSSLSPSLCPFIVVSLVTHPDRFSRDAVDNLPSCMGQPKVTWTQSWLPDPAQMMDQVISTGPCQPQSFPNSATLNSDLKFWSRSRSILTV